MPTTCYRPEIVDATMVGFGKLSNGLGLETKKNLLFTEMRTLPSQVCQQYFPFNSQEMFFCATNEKLKLSQRGDSGGPLVSAQNGTLIGLTILGDRKYI